VNTALGIQALDKTAQECRVKNMAVSPVHGLEWFKVLVAIKIKHLVNEKPVRQFFS
jgi:hypothetical protein